MAISTKFTHADLLVMPNDGKRREIIDGDLYVTPSPRYSHQKVSARIFAAFVRYLDTHPIGEIAIAPLDVILSDFDVLEPDLLFVMNEHRNVFQDWVRGAPDLVIEILSPTTNTIDRGPKLKAYARYGVAEYWIVDPVEKAVEVYSLTPTGYQLTRSFSEEESLSSAMLPGFELQVGSLFQP
jgi:Uma2 family endonuclease